MIPKATKKNYVDNKEFYNALVAFKVKVNAAKKAHDDLMAEWKKQCTPILKTLRKDNPPLYLQFTEDKDYREEEGEWPRDITVHYGLPKEPKYVAPRIPEYIGKCIWLISEGVVNMWKFCRYSYRDEMGADGIEDCILRVNSFNTDLALYTVKNKQVLSNKFLSSDVKKINAYTQKEYNTNLDEEEIKKKIKNIFSTDIEYGDFILEVRRNPFAYFTQICYFAAVRRIKKEKKQKDVKSALVKNSNVLDELAHTTQTGDDAEYHNSYLQFLLENVDNASQTEEEKEEAQRTYKKTTKAHQKYLKEKELELNTDGVMTPFEEEEIEENTSFIDFGLDE